MPKLNLKAHPRDEARPLVVRVDDACRMLGFGRDKIYHLIKSRELDSYFDGLARKITTASIEKYVARQLAAAPTFAPGKNPRARRGTSATI
jgi:excisionase family DNA binding protein